MKAVVWRGKEDVRVEHVPDPELREPTDAIVRITATAICGSDLHLYAKIGRPFMRSGDIVGHEPLGVVEAVGSEVRHVAPGDRVVIPFNVSCGECFMCVRGLQSQCETTQNRAWRKGASLLGYTHMYGAVPGGQAEYLRVPMAHYGPVKLPPNGAPDERLVLLADVLPTAWQAVEYAGVTPGTTVAVWGLGPIGQMCARIALHRGAARVIGIDRVPERLELAQRRGVETVDEGAVDHAWKVVRELTDGRGADAVVDAVGMEAHSGALARALQTSKLLPDRLNALYEAARSLRRGGTLSIVGVYVGYIPLFPLGELMDRQITIRMGQANVRRWIDDLLPLVLDEDRLHADDLVTHVLPLERAPEAYELFQQKRDGCVKVVLKP